ncbi:YqjF family protein [Paenibacillus rigui]|uniref:DUF2071 domain-containing protein n=1 Tax=Paenibacillus rigui TaxID=554312 RepID=A0A229UNG9_9BACL|nr:DUF2071 domain-containing protein [Paenibacillus rigui]OXM84864.1 hypothetical protein CF651_18330 [Paenibacillus rigui]
MHELLQNSSHRPWPLPKLPWIMKQTWHDLLFAHWPVPVGLLRPWVPDALPLDTFGGNAWIAVVPFGMTGIRARGLPPIPGTSRFPEINVRTYVTLQGKPGVYFFSLDAAHALAVWGARRFYRLPYYLAEMKLEKAGQEIRYLSRRADGTVQFEGRYRPVSPVFEAAHGSLERWLTERYCLYTLGSSGEPMRCDIHHPVWPLQLAEAELRSCTMLTGQGLPSIGGKAPLLHYASRLDVLIWPLVKAQP